MPCILESSWRVLSSPHQRFLLRVAWNPHDDPVASGVTRFGTKTWAKEEAKTAHMNSANVLCTMTWLFRILPQHTMAMQNASGTSQVNDLPSAWGHLNTRDQAPVWTSKQQCTMRPLHVWGSPSSCAFSHTQLQDCTLKN